MAIGDDKYFERDPRHHVLRVKTMLVELREHLREEGAAIEDPRAQALLDTTAGVLDGLVSAYERYESHSPESPHGS